MPPHTRSQRRRQGARQQQPRPAVSAETPEYADTASALDAPAMPAMPAAPAAPATRSARNLRRVISRAAPEPIDYTADYGAARRDLRWIAIWSVLLFAAMVALKFSGLV